MSKKKKKGQGISVACGDVVKGMSSEGKEVKGTVYRVNKKKGFVRIESKGGAHYRLLVNESFKVVKEDADARRRSSVWARSHKKDEEGKEGKKSKGKKKDKKEKAEKKGKAKKEKVEKGKKGKGKSKSMDCGSSKSKVKGKGKDKASKKKKKHEDSEED
jgi:hypothetical protein